MPQAILFDVNGTLLDIYAAQPELARIFGPAFSFREWFLEVLQYSFALDAVGDHRELSEVMDAVLTMNATAQGVVPGEPDLIALRHKMTQLPAFEDVEGGLRRLVDAGIRLATLSNSSQSALEKQIANAGLGIFFERNLSVETVGKFKPAREAYEYAAQELGLPPGDIMMVTAHGWDALGAARAGMRVAFVERPGKSPFPLASEPEITGADFDLVVAQIRTLQMRQEPVA
jgi:2-haloacid dehalogenase